jgi:hypothetical protein
MNKVFIIMGDDYPEGLPYGVYGDIKQAVTHIKDNFSGSYWDGCDCPYIYEYKIDSNNPICRYNRDGKRAG